MVSKIIKRTPTKSIRDNINHHRRRSRKRSPIKNSAAATSAAVVASIHKSIYACHRRLIKLFSKLSRTSTPKKRTPRKKGYQILKKLPEDPSLRRSLFTENSLPPSITPEKKTVFLDLDETLVHSVPDPPPAKFDFIVRPVIDGERVNFYVKKRPFVEEFLEILGRKFEIVIFTAGIKEYASLVLNRIDRNEIISHKLYRDSCKNVDGKFVKDLSELGRDLKNVVIVDDNPNCYMLQPENAIPILPFIDDLEDRELQKLVEFFEGFDDLEDMRDAVKNFLEEGNKSRVEI